MVIVVKTLAARVHASTSAGGHDDLVLYMVTHRDRALMLDGACLSAARCVSTATAALPPAWEQRASASEARRGLAGMILPGSNTSSKPAVSGADVAAAR
mmetsp:Transcript_27997/g.72044  ORF Transcript_27997/g.72044 Transcript_27997/m.72044 type:complete len:99 (-) Transcript_27997:1314-1610(-)